MKIVIFIINFIQLYAESEVLTHLVLTVSLAHSPGRTFGSSGLSAGLLSQLSMLDSSRKWLSLLIHLGFQWLVL